MISLLRIDDRLIHGQVVVGWGVKLNPDRYVIIDDDLEDWESDIYLGCLENESCGCILSTEEAAKKFAEWEACKDHIVILVKCPKTLERLVERGIQLPEVNLGGLHYLEGKTQYQNCLYLYEEERESLERLCNSNKICYQPLPSDSKLDVSNLIKH